ncbi:hypothetical protein D3C72_758190 [compost metagenome]
MAIETFNAGVRYNDFLGTIAADDADLKTLQVTIRNKLGLPETERIIGYQFTASYAGTRKIQSISLDAYSSSDPNVSDQIKSGETITVKKTSSDLTVEEFFALFKSFNICLSNSGKLNGATLDVV